MRNVGLVWLLIAVLVIVVLAVAGVLRARNSGGVPSPRPEPLDDAPEVVPPLEPAVEPPSAPTPPSGTAMVAPVAAADPAMAALEPRVPTRRVGARAADVLVDSLRRAGPVTGSVLPSGDGSSASDPAYRIKASTTTRRFYEPESPQYPHVRAELWFRLATDAERAGFTGAR